MVLVKKWPFFQLLFLGNKRQEHVFYDILEGENTFLGFKNKKFKKPKSDIFRKGLTHGFGPKMAIFPISLFLCNIGKENVFYDIQERNNPCLVYKNKKFKKSKNWHFSKGVNPWFWSKNAHFSNFFF